MPFQRLEYELLWCHCSLMINIYWDVMMLSNQSWALKKQKFAWQCECVVFYCRFLEIKINPMFRSWFRGEVIHSWLKEGSESIKFNLRSNEENKLLHIGCMNCNFLFSFIHFSWYIFRLLAHMFCELQCLALQKEKSFGRWSFSKVSSQDQLLMCKFRFIWTKF